MLTHPTPTNRPPINRVLSVVMFNRLTGMMTTVTTNNTTMRTAAIRSTMSSRVNSTGSLRHGASRTIRSIAGSAAPSRAVMASPAGLVREDCRVEAVEGVGACSIDEGSVADEGDVVDWIEVRFDQRGCAGGAYI